jgi:phage/plasmid primase-like uncharacterized protein
VNFNDLMSARGGRQGKVDIPCPICGPERPGKRGRRGVMRTWLKGDDFIGFNCARCGAKGSVTAENHEQHNISYDPLAAMAARQRVAEAEAEEAREQREKLERAEAIWNASIPLDGTPGQAWLEGRGIDLSEAPNHGLRFHAECPYEGSPSAPSVIARYSDALTGEPKGIRRRPILAGHKAITLGPMRGCVIRLWPVIGEYLCIAEGIETALYAATRRTIRGERLTPMWATGSAGNMQRFPVLPTVRRLMILADNDENNTGQNAAAECAKRWTAAGREVIISIPKAVDAPVRH